jgi:hypothetical protein
MNLHCLFTGTEAIGVVGGMRGWNGRRWLLAALVMAGLWPQAAWAAGPVETNIFAVQGVAVDVTAKDASAAKDQALMDVQVKAFFELIAKLGSPEIADKLKDMKPEEIAPYLKSLSIEDESSAPGRYIGTFTVRFLPTKVLKLLSSYGVTVPTQQAAPVIVLPVWKTPEGPQLWEDNPWRKAWLDLHAEQAMVPLIVPLGDFEDTSTLSPQDALNNDPVKIEAVRRRYDAPSILVAAAEPAEGGGVHVTINGDTRLGRVNFDKVYTADDGTLDGAILAAVTRFNTAMSDKYRQDVAKAAADQESAKPHAMSVAVPFSSPTEWNGIRSRILSAPHVIGVDVSSLSTDGAVISLLFASTVETLQTSMESAGLRMSQVGGTWVIQPL